MAPLAVLLLAAVLRLPALASVPPGFQFDEAHNAIDAARVLAGERAWFFPDNGGREPLNIYLIAGSLAVLGRDHAVLAVRLVSAFAGLACVAVLAGCAARLLADRRLGLATAGLLAASYWHLHFSRYGIRAVFAPLWATAAVWCWHRAAAGGRGWRTPAALAGLFLALAAYSHPTGRLLPVILLAHALYRTQADRARARATWRALVVAGVTAAALFAPLGAYFLRHPVQFAGHPSDVSLVAVAAAHYGGSLARAALAQIAAVAGMLSVAGDPSTFHNLPGLPVFDPLTALCAVVGLGVGLAWLVGDDRRRRDTAVLVGLWLVVGLVPTLLSDRPPNYSRAIVALPPLVMLPAVGLAWFAARLPGGRPRRAGMPLTLAAGLIVAGAAWTGYHYVVAFPHLPGVRYSYDADKIEAYHALAAAPADTQPFVHPLWAGQATFAFLNAGGRVRALDGRDSLVFPADGRAPLVAFPAKEGQREGWYDDARALYGAVAQRGRVTDSLGAPLLTTLRVPVSARGDLRPPRDAPLEPAQFVGADFGPAAGAPVIRLVGVTVGAARAGAPVPLVLVWQALAPVMRDLTVFVHLTGPGGEPLGQDDREPAHASYRTSRWQPGDVVIDRYAPVLAAGAADVAAPAGSTASAAAGSTAFAAAGSTAFAAAGSTASAAAGSTASAAPAGEVLASVGWYDLASGVRLATSDGRDAVTLGPYQVRP